MQRVVTLTSRAGSCFLFCLSVCATEKEWNERGECWYLPVIFYCNIMLLLYIINDLAFINASALVRAAETMFFKFRTKSISYFLIS